MKEAWRHWHPASASHQCYSSLAPRIIFQLTWPQARHEWNVELTSHQNTSCCHNSWELFILVWTQCQGSHTVEWTVDTHVWCLWIWQQIDHPEENLKHVPLLIYSFMTCWEYSNCAGTYIDHAWCKWCNDDKALTIFATDHMLRADHWPGSGPGAKLQLWDRKQTAANVKMQISDVERYSGWPVRGGECMEWGVMTLHGPEPVIVIQIQTHITDTDTRYHHNIPDTWRDPSLPALTLEGSNLQF